MRFLGVFTVVAVLTTACGSDQKQSDQTKQESSQASKKQASSDSLKDNKKDGDKGNEVTIRFPEVSPKSEATQMVGINKISIEYYRPSVSDPETGEKRKIWGKLVPYGKRWRTGANDRTKISFSHDVEIQGQKLEAGTYSVFTIPGKDQWTIIFNNQLKGSPMSAYDKSKDALRVKAEPKKAPFHEMMTFDFKNVTDSTANIQLAWKRTRVPFNISTNTSKQIMAMMNKAVDNAGKDDWQVYSKCAGYLAGKEMKLKKAKSWVNKSLDIKEHWRNTWTKAEVMRASGKVSKAISLTEKALEIGEKAGMPGGYKDYMKDELKDMKEEAKT